MRAHELSKKYKISVNTLHKLEKKYGSMDEFYSQYVNAFLDGTLDEMELVPIVRKKTIKYFDLSEQGAIGTKVGYARLLSDLLGINMGFIAKESISRHIDNGMKRFLDDRQRAVLSSFYELEGAVHKPYQEFAAEYGISRARIGQIKEVAFSRLQKSELVDELKELLYDYNFTKRIATEFFEDEDVFYISEKSSNRKSKSKLIYIIFENTIKDLTITNNDNYINDCDELERKIIQSGIGKKQIQSLLTALDEKKRLIAMENSAVLTRLFEKKIVSRDTAGIEKIKIISLNPSTRLYNCLSKEGIYTVEQLLDYSLNDLKVLKEFGVGCLAELCEKLEQIGVRVPSDEGIPIRKGDIFYIQSEGLDDRGFYKAINEEMIRFYLDDDARLFLNEEMKKIFQNRKDKHDSDLLDLLNRKMIEMGIIPQFQISLKEFGLSTRSCTALENAGIKNVAQLLALTREEIRRINKLGPKSFDEIIKKIKASGIKVPKDDETIEVHNIGMFTSNCTKTDIARLAEQINGSDMDEDDKSFMLGELLKKSIKNLRQAYEALDRQIERYEIDIKRKGGYNISLSGKKSDDIISREKAIRSLKEKKLGIKQQICEIIDR